ncbi:MAG: MmgE/PrpD family protein [Chloroflexi bacterium]|nr:MmgE/PrpD family protein [Chloroflexota bacterium]
MDESKVFASFLSQLKYNDVPNDVIEHAQDIMLDQLGVEIAASTKPWSVAVLKYVRTFGGPAESTIVNYGDKMKAENAAFANATFGHGFEMDDTYLPSNTHPSCVIIPSALAVGERELTDGKTFLLAVVAGYEAMGRIGRTIAPSCVLRGFHPTATSGTFAAATVVGKIMGFDKRLMLDALSIAGSHSSGLLECTQTGGSVKRINAGIAAFGGIRAALLAQVGLTGPPTILEGRKGFWHAFSDGANAGRLTDDLGKEFIVAETSYKLYACGHLIHSALELTTKMLKQHKIKANDIEQIIMGTNKNAMVVVGTILEPEDVTQSQFSSPFGIAMCVVKGSNSFRDYNETNLNDPEIRAMARRVKMVVDDEVEATFPLDRAVKMTIKLKNGTTYQDKVKWLRGTPENPATRSEVEDKFRDLATIVFPDKRVDEIIRAVRGLDGMTNIATLSRLLVS